MQNLESNLYRIELCCPGMGAGPEQPVVGATTNERLSLSQYGFRIVNPYDVVGSIATFPLPFRAGSGVMTSGYLASHDVQLVGTIFDSTSYALWNSVSRDYLLRWLSIAAVRRDTYLRIGLSNGVSLTYYRLYCVLRESNIPFVPYTTMTVASPVTLNFYAYDPIMYEDTEGSVSFAVTHSPDGYGRGNTPAQVSLPGANRPVYRSMYSWASVDSSPIGRSIVTETITGIVTTVDAPITTLGHQVVVDNWNGLIYGGATTAFVNRIDKLTGSFWWSGKPTLYFYVMTENVPTSYTFYCRFLKPAANYFVTQTYNG
jgi:hypothetical protein